MGDSERKSEEYETKEKGIWQDISGNKQKREAALCFFFFFFSIVYEAEEGKKLTNEIYAWRNKMPNQFRLCYCARGFYMRVFVSVYVLVRVPSYAGPKSALLDINTAVNFVYPSLLVNLSFSLVRSIYIQRSFSIGHPRGSMISQHNTHCVTPPREWKRKRNI